MKQCIIAWCSRLHVAHGYCKPHYNRWSRYGDPLAGDPLPEQKAAIPEGFKDCSDCKERKQLDDYSPNKRGFRGRASRCKPCASRNVQTLNATPKDQRRKPGRPRKEENRPGGIRPVLLHPRIPATQLGHLLREHGGYTQAAHALGVPRHAVREWLKDPAYRAAVEPYHRRNDPAWTAGAIERRRTSKRNFQRRFRASYPELARQLRREQMAAYGPAYRRKWNHYNRLRRQATAPPPTLEAEVYLKLIAGDPCVYCGEPFEHADHIRPLAGGGTNDWDNYAPTCAPCNWSKNARDVLTFMLSRLSI